MLRIARSIPVAGVISFALLSAFAAGPATAGPASAKSREEAVTAEKYVSFRKQITEISHMRLDNAGNVERAKKMLVAHNERALSRGWVAHCAEIAARDAKFAASVEKWAEGNGGGAGALAKLQSRPESVFKISGWKSAADRVVKEVSEDAVAMQSLSYRLNEIAYGRTAKEPQLSFEARSASGVTGATRSSRRSAKAVSPLMTQILALGAVTVLSKDNPARAEPVAASLIVNKENDQCLRWSDLNLKQCLAAARDNQERAFCLSQEAVGSRSECWAKIIQPAT